MIQSSISLRQVSLPALVVSAITLSLSACTANNILEPVQKNVAITGSVYGGSLPVSGATIQLYAAGTGGDGTGATPLIASTVTTGIDGSFSLKGTFSCPVANPLVYIVATGGNPGLTSGTNPQLAMMTALGPCLSIGPGTHIAINEVTTVGTAAALFTYFSNAVGNSYTTLASSTTDASVLTSAYANVSGYVNTATGTAVGSSTVASTINSLANSITTCVNSSGGVAGDNSACGNLFTAATNLNSPLATPPTDTASAAIFILQHPFFNVSAVYNLATPTVPFTPALTSAPVSWAMPIGNPPSITPPNGGVITAALSFSFSISLADTDPTATIYYFVNNGYNSLPTQQYTGPFSVVANDSFPQITVYAYAVSASGAISSMSVGTYNYAYRCTTLCP